MSVRRILWGAHTIGRAINRKPRQVYHIADRGHVKSIRRVGNLLCADEDALLAELGSGGSQPPTSSPAAESADHAAT
jgi:hypothetical protein